jgi:hypothetical protein
MKQDGTGNVDPRLTQQPGSFRDPRAEGIHPRAVRLAALSVPFRAQRFGEVRQLVSG